jgi:hypothetical protein
MSNNVVVSTDVTDEIINEYAGRFRLNIFLASGSTITTSLGRRK